VLQNPTAERPARRRIAIAIATVLATAALVATASISASADDSTGISGGPSDGAGPDDRSRFSYQVDPGQHIDDFYLVRNTGTKPQTMTVLATDAFNTPQGTYSLLETKALPKDGGSWVTFAGGARSIEIPLAPNESRAVPFRLAVPADASPGDHAGGVVVSVMTPQGTILVDHRVATRLYVRVKGEIQAALTVGSIAADYTPSLNPFSGSTEVTFTVRNNGNVALGANLVVGAKTYFGIPASGLVRMSVSELLPGSTRKVTVSVPGVAQLGYLAPHVSLVPTTDADAISPGPLRTIERDTALFVMPWWFLAIIVLGAAIVLWIRLRRRSDRRRAATWIAYTEAEAVRKAAASPAAEEREPALSSLGATDEN
jgi:hypothetical protein